MNTNANASECTVLLAEDDPNEVLLIKRVFEKAGLKNPLLVARDGQEVIDCLDRNGPDDEVGGMRPSLVILDLKMPRKNGFEVLEWLRRRPDFERPIVVVFTSSNETKDINRAYALGANSYLVKPGSLKELVDLVKMLDVYWMRWNQPPVFFRPEHAENIDCLEAQPA